MDDCMIHLSKIIRYIVLPAAVTNSINLKLKNLILLMIPPILKNLFQYLYACPFGHQNLSIKNLMQTNYLVEQIAIKFQEEGNNL